MGAFDFTYTVPANFDRRVVQFLQQFGKAHVAQAFQRCEYEYEDVGLAYYAGMKGDNWNKNALDFTFEGAESDIALLRSFDSALQDAIGKALKASESGLLVRKEYLKVVRGIRNQQPFYVTDEDGEETGEDVALDDTWNYTDILWNGIQAEKVQRAFEKLNYREQTLLEKRLAICMTCGRVGSWKGRPTFEELAVMFEGSTASGAERAYRKAVDKLTELLVAEGALHAVRLKQKSKTKRKKKIAAAIYEYQADCDGEWGEISFDFENGTAEIIRLADWDTMKTNRYANRAIAYLLNCENEKLPKEIMVAFEL